MEGIVLGCDARIRIFREGAPTRPWKRVFHGLLPTHLSYATISQLTHRKQHSASRIGGTRWRDPTSTTHT